MDDTGFPNTRGVVDGYVREGLLPGASVLVRQNGNTALEYATGNARLDPMERATVEHIWPVASISKPVAVVALMQLVDAGYVHLDQPVVELLPEFGPGKADVLVRHLACHSSGVPDDWPDLDTIASLGKVAAIAGMDLLFSPGTACQYTTATFELISAIAHKLTGLDWDTYTRERIFAPLGLQNSSFNPPKMMV